MSCVAAVIPVFNRYKTIKKAIESVRQQKYIKEIIIVDDHSDDDTKTIVKSMGKDDDRIQLILLEENHGATYARNVGIERASCEYIAFLDSDDYWLPGKIEEQLNLFKANNNLAMVYTGIKTENKGAYIDEPAYISTKPYEQLLSWNYIGTTSTAMVKRKVLRDLGGFDVNLQSRQDLDLWLRIAEQYEIDAIQKPMVVMSIGGADRISRNNEKKIQGAQFFIEKHLAELNRHPVALSRNYHRIALFYRDSQKRVEAAEYCKKAFSASPSLKAFLRYLHYRIKAFGKK